MQAMQLLRRHKWLQNAHTADTIRFVPHFRELRFGWTAFAPMSMGMEKFVDEFLPTIRANNPNITYRLHSFVWDRKKKSRCCWKHELKILATVEQFSLGGDFRSGKRLGVTARLPRGQEIWDIETKGHNIFTVLDKWKGDPADPNEMKTMNHPHLKYQPMMCKKHPPIVD